jgi:hypothetical protein
MRKVTTLAVLVVLVSATAAVSAAPKVPDQRVALTDVPEPIKKAALAAVPGIELDGAELETDTGVRVYEFYGVFDGSRYEIEVDEKGKVVEVETEDSSNVEISHLPEVVTNAARKAVPAGAELTWAEMTTVDDGVVYVFDAFLEDKDWEIRVTPDGEVLGVTDTSSDGPAEDADEDAPPPADD